MFLTSPKIGTRLLRQSLPESLGGGRWLLVPQLFSYAALSLPPKTRGKNDILFGKNSDGGTGTFLSSYKLWRALVKPHVCNHLFSCRIFSFNRPRFPSCRKKLPQLAIPHFFFRDLYQLWVKASASFMESCPVWETSVERREKDASCRLLVHGGPEDPGEAQMLNLLNKGGARLPWAFGFGVVQPDGGAGNSSAC